MLEEGTHTELPDNPGVFTGSYSIDELTNVGNVSYGTLNNSNSGGDLTTLEIMSDQNNLDKLTENKNPFEFWIFGKNCIRLCGFPLLRVEPYPDTEDLVQQQLDEKKLKAMSLLALDKISDFRSDPSVFPDLNFTSEYEYAGKMLRRKESVSGNFAQPTEECVMFGDFLNLIFQGYPNTLQDNLILVWEDTFLTGSYNDQTEVPNTPANPQYWNGSKLVFFTDDDDSVSSDFYKLTAGEKVATILLYMFYNYRHQKMDSREYYLSEAFLVKWWDMTVANYPKLETLFLSLA